MWEGTMNQTWNCFDDSSVNIYTLGSNFEKDCFGENKQNAGSDDWAYGG